MDDATTKAAPFDHDHLPISAKGLRVALELLQARLALEGEADDGEAEPLTEAFEAAMRETWKMIDPFRPPPAGTYALGEHNGIIAALKTLRENYERAVRSTHGAPGR